MPVREGAAGVDEETLEGNDLMKDVILYLQKNLAIVWGSARTRRGLLRKAPAKVLIGVYDSISIVWQHWHRVILASCHA